MGRRAQRLVMGRCGLRARAQGHGIAPTAPPLSDALRIRDHIHATPSSARAKRPPGAYHRCRTRSCSIRLQAAAATDRPWRGPWRPVHVQRGCICFQGLEPFAVLLQIFGRGVQRLPQRSGLGPQGRRFLGRRGGQLPGGARCHRAVQPRVQRLHHQTGTRGRCSPYR